MMKIAVTMAAVAAISYAAPAGKRGTQDTQGVDERFLDFVAVHNKFPSNTEEFRRRKNNY